MMCDLADRVAEPAGGSQAVAGSTRDRAGREVVPRRRHADADERHCRSEDRLLRNLPADTRTECTHRHLLNDGSMAIDKPTDLCADDLGCHEFDRDPCLSTHVYHAIGHTERLEEILRVIHIERGAVDGRQIVDESDLQAGRVEHFGSNCRHAGRHCDDACTATRANRGGERSGGSGA